MTALKKIELDFVLNCSPSVLFNRLSTEPGLNEWFADKVSVIDDKYTFEWDGSEQTAILLESEKNTRIRFQWEEDEGTTAYFEFEIVKTEMSKEVALYVHELIDESDADTQVDLWETQVTKLKRVLGA